MMFNRTTMMSLLALAAITEAATNNANAANAAAAIAMIKSKASNNADTASNRRKLRGGGSATTTSNGKPEHANHRLLSSGSGSGSSSSEDLSWYDEPYGDWIAIASPLPQDVQAHIYFPQKMTKAEAVEACNSVDMDLVKLDTADKRTSVTEICKIVVPETISGKKIGPAGWDCTWLGLSCQNDEEEGGNHCDSDLSSWTWDSKNTKGHSLLETENGFGKDKNGKILGGGKDETCAHFWGIPDDNGPHAAGAEWGPQRCDDSWYGALCEERIE